MKLAGPVEYVGRITFIPFLKGMEGMQQQMDGNLNTVVSVPRAPGCHSICDVLTEAGETNIDGVLCDVRGEAEETVEN